MNKIKLASGVILVFLVGVLAGSLGTGFYYKNRVKKFEAGGPPVQERIQIILGRFSNELNLTSEQRTEFEKIIRESQEKKIALGKKMQPDIKQINDDTFKSIKNKLTEEQKTKLDTLIKRMDDVHDRFPSVPHQQQRTPDPSHPQQQDGPDQGDQQQKSPEQTLPQGTSGQNPLPETPNAVMPKNEAIEEFPYQRHYMHLAGDLKDQLTLTKEQDEKLRSLIEKFSKDQKNAFEKNKQDKKDSKALKIALLETEKSFEKDLSTLLTKEQMEKYRKAKESGAVKISPPDMP